jgi:hypothetical protein
MPVAVLNASTKREQGRRAQVANIQAAKVGIAAHAARALPPRVPWRRLTERCAAPPPAGQAVADIIRTTLGPRSMLKMLLDASGGGCCAALRASLFDWHMPLRAPLIANRAHMLASPLVLTCCRHRADERRARHPA